MNKKGNQRKMTEQQIHIAELRKKINTPDPEYVDPFTKYKILTYLCIIMLPIMPYGCYRLWSKKSEFSRREQIIWTVAVVLIIIYEVKFVFFS